MNGELASLTLCRKVMILFEFLQSAYLLRIKGMSTVCPFMVMPCIVNSML